MRRLGSISCRTSRRLRIPSIVFTCKRAQRPEPPLPTCRLRFTREAGLIPLLGVAVNTLFSLPQTVRRRRRPVQAAFQRSAVSTRFNTRRQPLFFDLFQKLKAPSSNLPPKPVDPGGAAVSTALLKQCQPLFLTCLSGPFLSISATNGPSPYLGARPYPLCGRVPPNNGRNLNI